MNGFDLIIKPDEDDAEAAEVLVDGTIGGNPYRFLLDTGAAGSCVRLDDYTATFESVGKSTSSGVFAKSSSDRVTVPTIEVGPISRKNFTLTRQAETEVDVRNLIGMDLLKDLRCHFLFNENRVMVNSNAEAEVGYNLQELFLDSRFHPYVEVEFGAAKGNAVWDTGAGITVVDLSFIKKFPDFFQEVGHSTGTDSSGFKLETPMFTMAATTIANNIFPPHKVAGVDLSLVNSTIEVPMDLILGYSTLSKANWLFDFPGKRWAITKMLDIG
jgi:hypothetical protein